MAFKASPPLKAKLLYDEDYRPHPSPVPRSHTAPLLRDTIRVSVGEEGAEDDARGGGAGGICARVSEWECPTPKDVSNMLFAPCCARTGYLRRMRHNFGLPFLLMLTSVYFGTKGMLVQIVSLAKLPFYRAAGVDAKLFQRYDVVTRTPWALKAFFGAVADLYPLCGYGKRSYMTGVSVVGTGACVLLSLATSGGAAGGSALGSVIAITLCFVGVNLQASVVDLLAEGAYTAAMARAPWSGSDCVSWVWACVQGGSFVSAALVGWAADAGRTHALFPLAAVLAAQVFFASEAGWLGDARLPPPERGFQSAKLRAAPRVFALSALMALAGLGLGVCNLLEAPPGVLLGASLGSSAVLCALAFWALPLVLAKCNLYLYLASILYVQISGAVDYFYVAQPPCVEEGPHFSFRYYITYSAVVQALFGYVGVLLFQACMRKWTFRAVLGATVVLEVAAGAVDLVIVMRWNVTYLHIPDHVMYMLGYNVVFQVASMLNFMPSVILTSKLCPPRMEATVFALLAGFQNFGSMVAGSLGVCLVNALGIRTHAPAGAAEGAEAPCDFRRLPHAIVLSHMLLPLLTVPLAYVLLPDARLIDEISVMGKAVRKEGAADGDGGGGAAARKRVPPSSTSPLLPAPLLQRAASDGAEDE